jgi:thiosulfate reductase cytochrome b subunit
MLGVTAVALKRTPRWRCIARTGADRGPDRPTGDEKMHAETSGMTRATQRGRCRKREVIYRHTFLVRLTHWLNALTITLMVGSGLNIFNAHPRLYWGARGDEYDHPLLSVYAQSAQGGMRGITQIGGLRLDTTGVLGWSNAAGEWTARAWPVWITIPSFPDLADARHWHFLFAWVLVANGVLYLAWSLATGHVRRNLLPTWADLRAIPRSIIDHLMLRHPRGEAAKRYNVLQRLAYLGVIAAIVGMVATGLALSPGIGAFAPWLADGLGGRQSARTLHFIFASLICLFIAVHVAEVVLAGPVNELRSMLTGSYAVPEEHQ